MYAIQLSWCKTNELAQHRLWWDVLKDRVAPGGFGTFPAVSASFQRVAQGSGQYLLRASPEVAIQQVRRTAVDFVRGAVGWATELLQEELRRVQVGRVGVVTVQHVRERDPLRDTHAGQVVQQPVGNPIAGQFGRHGTEVIVILISERVVQGRYNTHHGHPHSACPEGRLPRHKRSLAHT